MNNEQQIVELAKKLRGHAWLARFRKADDKKNNYAHLSDQSCNDIAGYVDELLDLINPPQPTVDWEKAIGIYFGEKLEELELIGPLDPPDHTGCTRVVYSRIRNALYTCREDGTNGPGSEVRVINIYSKPDPAPIEPSSIVCEGTTARNTKGWQGLALSCMDGERVAILAKNDSAMMVFGSVEEAMASGWSFDRWELGTWHPRTVTG